MYVLGGCYHGLERFENYEAGSGRDLRVESGKGPVAPDIHPSFHDSLQATGCDTNPIAWLSTVRHPWSSKGGTPQ